MTRKATVIAPANELAQKLRTQIRAGAIALGDRLPTERELATKNKVSRTTVRQAMDILQSERLIVRQQGRGTFVTDPHHAPISSADANWIGTLVYEREYYFEPVVQAASAQASRRGFATATGMNDSSEVETLHVSAFIKNRVRGVVMAPHGIQTRNNYQRLLAAGLKVVLIDNLLEDVQEDYVVVDNHAGTSLAVRSLAELGHRHIGYLGHNHPHDIPCQQERRRGYVETCQAMNLPQEPRHLIEADYRDMPSAIAQCLRGRNRPTAFVAYNDVFAVHILKVAKELDLSVPRDLSIIAFDNSTVAERATVGLTSVDPEPREMGILAVNLLIDKLENPRPRPTLGMLITPKLAIRQTTAPPNKGA